MLISIHMNVRQPASHGHIQASTGEIGIRDIFLNPILRVMLLSSDSNNFFIDSFQNTFQIQPKRLICSTNSDHAGGT